MPRDYVSFNMYTPAMKAAVVRLRKKRVEFEVMTPHHLKSGRYNFYPSRGVIYRDGDFKALTETGLAAFLSFVG